MMAPDAVTQFRAALARRHIIAPERIEADGKLHRCDAEGPHGQADAAYLLHLDGVPAGGFQNHRDGLGWQNWRADVGRELSPSEEQLHREQIKEARLARRADHEIRLARSRDRAAAIWQAGTPADGLHPYLARKHVAGHGTRTYGDTLIVPIRDGLELHSLQFIAPDGTKRFLKDGRVAGCYCAIGEPNGVLCIAEGYATAATINEATGHAVAAAFHAGNLLAVAQAMRARHPRATLVVCADDDYRTRGNPGLTAAIDAARAVDALLAVPDFGADGRPEYATDFNDLALHAGAEAVKRYIEAARRPPHSAPSREAGAAPAPDDEVARVHLIRGDTIAPEPVRWMWDGYLATGKLHMLAGRAGAGKTTLALAIAATITIGGRWPDGSSCDAGDVLIWSGEDDPSDTLAPRLIASGADMKRVHFVHAVEQRGERVSFDPARHMAALELAASRIGNVRMLLIDPVVSAVAGDGNNNAEVRRALQPLVDFAVRLRCAALGISHFTKGTQGREPAERVTGSLAFGAAPRIVLVAAKLWSGERIMVRAKSNIGPDADGFGYNLEQVPLPDSEGVFASRVVWTRAVSGAARDLLREAEDDGAEDPDAGEFLRELLRSGPMKVPDLLKAGKQAGFSEDQMQRAKRKIGARARKDGMQGGWKWDLGGAETRTAEDGEDCGISRVPPSARCTEDREGCSSPPSSNPGYDPGGDPEGGTYENAPSSRPSGVRLSPWRVRRCDGSTFEIQTQATAAELNDVYPGAQIVSAERPSASSEPL